LCSWRCSQLLMTLRFGNENLFRHKGERDERGNRRWKNKSEEIFYYCCFVYTRSFIRQAQKKNNKKYNLCTQKTSNNKKADGVTNAKTLLVPTPLPFYIPSSQVQQVGYFGCQKQRAVPKSQIQTAARICIYLVIAF